VVWFELPASVSQTVAADHPGGAVARAGIARLDRAATPGRSTTTRHFSPFPWSAVTCPIVPPRFETVSMTVERDKLSKTVARTIAITEGAVPQLATARDLIGRLHNLIRGRDSTDLEAWLLDAKLSLVSSFAKGIVQDQAAAKAALTEPWSKGHPEGQNTKLKLVKRQMYGRAGLDLLRARLLGAT
jgi:hypothetical protein